ncbi:Cytochrome P450 CYP4/CYP19/CYP26 subfamily [Handroanthus impetiginosus]|uniref:Cytochrome P450 CYP4/CYP19/CYP26 subfamily n=1 Tax=Handroanthus impetiginosus TaxID=429701 RepID=A0A2G9IA64_9LAMI|nr:Cytochrome P450 CYP4/CYP19/CYP26 subfamily [Handroanthus impetiginosus]
MLIITTCVAILAIWIIWAVFGLSAKKEKKTYHPVVGTVFHLLLNFHRYNDYLNDLNRRNTTFRIVHLSSSEIYTSDPANIEHMLKTNFANYGKGSLNYDILKDLLGDGIFTVDGEKWRRQRKMSSYEFSTRNLREFSSGVFKINAAKLAHIVSASVTSNQTIEIQDMFMKSALDSVFNVVLGVDLDMIRGTNEEFTEFTKAFDEASELTTFRYVDPSWRIKKFLNIGSEATLKKRVKVIDEFVYKVIQSKMDQISKPNKDLSRNKGDVLSRFIEMNETDPKYLKDIILSFVLAGKDSTAVSLSWFFYMMCKHPRFQEKIADEVRQVAKIKENSSIDDIAKSITEEALDKMQLLHAALTETLRLYPAVPQDGKVCFSDDTFPDGYSVKKGMMVSYVPYSMGKMKSLWGEDAEEFRPERWLDQKGVFQQESSFKFTAFQAGPRICLGKEFAYRQMKVFAAVLLSAFSFTLADDRKPVKHKTTITLQIDGGLHLRASRRIVN